MNDTEKTAGSGSLVRAPTAPEIAAARARLAGRVRHTPVLAPGAMQDAAGLSVFLKCEQFQQVGAFKARGAMNAVLSLSPDERSRGVATHSSGNHGAALAWAAHEVGIEATIVVPSGAVATKRAAIERYGARIVDCGPTQHDRETKLTEVVAATGACVIHPYDDARVIAGQATATIELLQSQPAIGRLLVPVGGGGLASGAVLAARWLDCKVDIIGVEPVGADDTRRSLAAGRRVALEQVETVADGLRAQVGRATFPVLQAGLSDLLTVTDAEIMQAMRWAIETAKLVIEPSAATVLAALLNGKVARREAPIGAIISGGNVDVTGETWSRIWRK